MTPLMAPDGRVNVKELCAQAGQLTDRVIAARAQVRQESPHYNTRLDARVTCFSRFENVLGSFQLSCAFWMNHLLSPSGGSR